MIPIKTSLILLKNVPTVSYIELWEGSWKGSNKNLLVTSLLLFNINRTIHRHTRLNKKYLVLFQNITLQSIFSRAFRVNAELSYHCTICPWRSLLIALNDCTVILLSISSVSMQNLFLRFCNTFILITHLTLAGLPFFYSK